MSNLTLAMAQSYIEKAIRKAKELGVAMSVAVVDDGGHLVGSARMDGGLFLTPDIARGKAYTAVAFKKPTVEVVDRFKGRDQFITGVVAMEPGNVVIGSGGIPIVQEGRIIGGIGLSGGTPEQDHVCAETALSP